MAQPVNEIPVYLEVGQKRAFAGALDWPGWCRAGRDEDAALAALFDYGPRYARAVTSSGLGFVAPAALAALVVVERLPGSSGTDFGAPGAQPEADRLPFGKEELARSEAILTAIWQTFDETAGAAVGRELRKGPRGGGRELDKIVEHVRGADEAYLARLAWKRPQADDPAEAHALVRRAMFDALAAAVRGELPERGPRGGRIWPPRFFVRYVAWHTLDHVWEIEDRAI
ncbi:hypothetical protein [Promineifilum sp.]|uniref:hypothetical protein n=1 Tax=Promineifilum sp. TaxID=2664178 RepID=UPI0035B17D35